MYFSGRVHTVLFENPEQAFYILKMSLDGAVEIAASMPNVSIDRVSVRGHVPGLGVKIGTWFGFEGTWTTHKEYGPQINIVRAPVLQGGWDVDTAYQMLVGNGVGERLLFQIRNQAGDAAFLNVLGDVEALKKLSGVDEFTALFIHQRWGATQTYFKTLTYLGELGLPAGRIRQIWETFGGDAEKVLGTNPWSLVRIEGIPFVATDEIARKLGLDMGSPNRAKGAVLYVTKGQRNLGHLFMRTGQIVAEVRQYIPDISDQAIAESLRDLHVDKSLRLDRETLPGVTAVYDPWAWTMESEATRMLGERKITAKYGDKTGEGLDVKAYIDRLSGVGNKTLKASKKKGAKLLKVAQIAIEEWGGSTSFVLSKTQEEGVLHALTEPISILTGLPGTGKTTSLFAVVRILQDSGIPFLLCAPTGIAAKRLASLTGAYAYTIHRAFAARGSFDERRETTYAGIVGDSDVSGAGNMGEGEFWGYDADSPHPAEVVIIDESSMVDQHLLYRLLSCTSSKCRMVFVGDAAQLPPVGPGNVLRDLIGSGRFPVTSLTEIFRQKDTSDIVFAAHAIYRGEVPEAQRESDFSLIETESDEQVLEVIRKLARKLYDKRKNFQVLSPKHAGTVGVTNLNSKLRALLNPAAPGLAEVKVGDDTIREDDRIMVIKNDYKLGVFNGDVGKIARIDRKAKEVEIKIFGETPLYVKVEFKNVPSLIRLAYACTVHKAQGLEYECIVMPLVDSFKHQLQRNLLYTAVTRAKQRVFLVGTRTALATAIRNDKEDQRNTLFRPRLEAVIPAE